MRLRPFAAADLSLVAELAADPYIPLIGTVPATFTAAAGLAYLERQHQRLRDGQGWSFAIADRETDRAVGGAGLWVDRRSGGHGGVRGGAAVPRPGLRDRGAAGVDRLCLDPPRAGPGRALHRARQLASIAVARRCGYAEAGLVPEHTRSAAYGGTCCASSLSPPR